MSIKFVPSEQDPNIGLLDMEVTGPWLETILWEVPLMSLLSESYFQVVDRDWDYEGQEGATVRLNHFFHVRISFAELAYRKGMMLLESDIAFSEFGTRRRRSHHTHDLVVAGLKRAAMDSPGSGGKLVGTSNVSEEYFPWHR